MTQALKLQPRPLERRRHHRVKVTLFGRFMLENRQEFPCQTINASPGGLALYAPVRGCLGERIVVYLEQIGRVEGTVTRVYEHGFAIALQATRHKMDKLASQLTWLANRDELGMPEDRRHERSTPPDNGAIVRFSDGREVGVRIIDVSLSGAAVSSPEQPTLGTPVLLGETPARVVRLIEGGFAVEFGRILAEAPPGGVAKP